MSGKIVGSVRGQVLHLIYPPLVEGTVDYLTAEFSFSGDWDGLSKWAHFKQGSTIYDVPLTNDAITEDQHLNLSAGTWDVYLHGSGDNRRITTTTVRMKVLPYLDEDGEPLPEVPLTFAEVLDQRAQQIQAVASVVEAGESARKEAERSRELSEFARVQAEAERTGAEAGRASAETERASAETARKNAEQDRVSSEDARSSAEVIREQNEEERQAAEAIREQNEEARVEAEKNRKDGITPHIGDNGNWYLGDTDTGKPSRGETGAGMDITGATVDQIAKITAVDDMGKPTAWEAVDISSFAPAPFKPAGKSYLTFSSSSSFTLAVNDATKHWDSTLEYFASDKTWTTWDGTTTLSAVSNDGEYVLYLRGTGNTVITGSSANHRWVLTGTDIKCIGNIENLLDYTTVASGEHPTMASSCYSFMFRGCTGLTQAPELPATTLADNCYQGMFQGCTSITQAPALPAITLASYCYYSMFYGCKCLTQAPALPATTLENSCYSYIFSGCTSLTQAPALPVTTLASNCYRYMFYGCTSLKLSSTKTGEYTQEYRIPSSGDGVAATDALADMFTSTGGTFTGTPAINTTYYLRSDNMIVRETEIDTLNGYVGSMIDVAIAEHTSNPLNITGATVGQIAKITAVDDSGKPTAWEAVDMPSGGGSDGWTEIGEITLEGTEFIISAYSDGVVTITPENGVYPQVNKNTVLRKSDYSSYVNVSFVATGTDGQYTMKNLDGAVYAPSDDLTQYVVDVPSAGFISFSNIPEFSFFKAKITTPLLSIHGLRVSFTSSYGPFNIVGTDCASLSGGAVEVVLETEDSPIAGKIYSKGSFKGKSASRTNGYDIIRMFDRPTAPANINFSHYNFLLTIGTKVKLWGRN